jgi:hypothetical protein
MASDAQNTLYDIFSGLYRQGGESSGGGLTSTATQATAGANAAGSGGGPGTKNAESAAGKFGKEALKNGLGLAGLVMSLFGVFDADEPDKGPALVKYALPAAREVEVAQTASGYAAVDYDQAGMARAYEPRGSKAPQVNVTVQAMDARSFLDRSTEIAAAVREAMLNLNSINDVVNDL